MYVSFINSLPFIYLFFSFGGKIPFLFMLFFCLNPPFFSSNLCWVFLFLHKNTLVLSVTAFRYQKNQYNVFEVNQTGYDNCTTEGAVGNWSSGKDFIPLNKAKRYYFICGNGQCFSGMKVSVLVHPLAPPPSAAAAANHNSTHSSAPVVPTLGFGSLLVPFALFWFGSVCL